MDLCSASDCAQTTVVTPADNPEESSASDGNAQTNDWGVDKVAGSDLVLALYGAICAVGVTGNLLVCFVLLRVPSLRSNTSDFLVHLSLVDLIVCALVVPYKIVPQLVRPSPPDPTLWGQLRCRLYVSQYLFWSLALASVWNLVLVNLERFAAIVYPHRYKRIFGSRRSKCLMLGLCWALALLTKFFVALLYDEDPVFGCRFLGWPSRGAQATIGTLNFLVNLFVPFVLMISVQCKVILTLRRQVKTLTHQTGIWQLTRADRRKMWQLRTTQVLVRTLLAFGVTFAVCWAPNQLMFLLYNVGVALSFASPVYHIGVILAVCNSCVNPIIYTLTNQQFRGGIRAALAGRGGKRSARVGDDASGPNSGPATLSTRCDTK